MRNRNRLRAIVVQLGLFSFATFITLIAPEMAGSASANEIFVTSSTDVPIFILCNLRQAIQNHNSKGQPNPTCGAGRDEDTIFFETMPDEDVGSPLSTISGNLTLNYNFGSCNYIRGGY